jgi:hypothetical protein
MLAAPPLYMFNAKPWNDGMLLAVDPVRGRCIHACRVACRIWWQTASSAHHKLATPLFRFPNRPRELHTDHSSRVVVVTACFDPEDQLRHVVVRSACGTQYRLSHVA